MLGKYSPTKWPIQAYKFNYCWKERDRIIQVLKCIIYILYKFCIYNEKQNECCYRCTCITEVAFQSQSNPFILYQIQKDPGNMSSTYGMLLVCDNRTLLVAVERTGGWSQLNNNAISLVMYTNHFAQSSISSVADICQSFLFRREFSFEECNCVYMLELSGQTRQSLALAARVIYTTKRISIN